MYPIKFNTIYIHKPWGGRDLERYKPDLPEGIIGETWDISSHPEGTNLVTNGRFKDMSLTQLIEQEGDNIVGSQISTSLFPLMIRYVSAREKLSVQVHPDDEYAHHKNEPMGKTEAWYILDAKDGAYLYAGTVDCTEDEIKQASEDGSIETYLKKLYVTKGDVVLIPSGMVHAICEGLTLIEICCNSNTTYRMYDYGRGRGLDLTDAFAVMKLDKKGYISKGLESKKDGYSKTYLCLDKSFSWELYDVNQSFSETSDLNRFFIFTCIEGSGTIHHSQGLETIQNGESVLIPAALGQYEFVGQMKLLKSYVPDVAQVEKEILQVVQ